MKKLLLCATIAVAMCFASCEGFDASEILDRLDNVENQLDDLKNKEENQGGDNSGDTGEGNTMENNKIYYTTSDNTKLFPKTDASLYGAIITSNTYKDGQGVLTFDDAVTSIGYEAFNGCSSLTSVTIPDSVTSIGERAFQNCSSLTSVTIPDSVISIGGSAFYYCSSLTSVTIPDSVISIGGSAFKYCFSLPIIDNIQYADTYLICVTDQAQTVYSISENTRFIGDGAFSDCSSLTSVTIPDSVTEIGGNAFSGCTSLARVDISDLSAWCKIGFGSTSANPLSNGAKLYLNGSELTDITIPSDITEIKAYAFYKCTSLTSVTIPDSVTSIGFKAFTDCSSLTSVTIGNSVTEIGSSAFWGCTSLKEVYCKPTTPPAVSADGYNYTANCSFQAHYLEVIYVPRDSYDAYMQYQYSDTVYHLDQRNWGYYKQFIQPYDFE